MHNIDTTYCKPANLIPHFWFYEVTDKDGRPDLPCIILLSEIFGWFRRRVESNTYYSRNKSLPKLVDGKLAISYDYLSDKLNFQKERIRKNFIKLEALGLLTRIVKNIALEDGSRINQLYISIDQEFFNSCFCNPELDIRLNASEPVVIDYDANEPSQPTDGEQISKKNKNRSIESNFVESNYALRETKQLSDFYPLTQEDCSMLQSLSGREFSLNAMNEILKDMSGRVSGRFFYSKKGFLAYMSKVFIHEMRDSVRISNENFKIGSNQDTSKREIQKQERYLAEIENSLQVSPEWHLKKKLTSVLARGKAYNVLTAYRYLEIGQDSTCRLFLCRHVELSDLDKEIILSQIRASHERMEGDGSYISITSLSIQIPDYSTLPNKDSKNPEGAKANVPKTGHCQIVKTTSTNKKITIWEQIREKCISYYGENGRYVDQNWLSKLSPQINGSKKTITLQAPGDFIKDWVEEKYGALLENVCRSVNYNYAGVV